MSDDTKGKRGEAAWREQREAVSKRNAEARRRGRIERESRERLTTARRRSNAQQEAELLHKLNLQMARGQGGSQ